MFAFGSRSISRSRMNRVAAIQKSSRTSTIAWTCSPSHCRRAATSSVFSSPCRANSHCSNWSSTSSTFWPGRSVRPRRSAARASTRPSPGPGPGHALRRPFEQPGLGLRRGRLDVDRQDVLGQPGQQPRLDQRRLAAARGAVDQADLEGGVGVGRLDPGLPEPEALGQAVAVARAGQELEEEVGVVLVERPQALGDDLDRFTRGSDRRAEPGGGLTGPGVEAG